MKRKLLSLLILALLPLMASADAVQINGIYYNLDAEAKTAEVTSNPDKYSGSISIPETVFNTNDYVEYDVTSIGDEAFRWCHEITSIVFPTQLKLKSIGFAAMYACSKLTSVVLPEGLVSIGQKAFTDCTSLESVTVPSTVTKIDPSAFNGCPSLTSFICKIETPLEIKESVFGDRSIITLYVPEGCKDAYVNSEYWQGFKDIVEGGEGTNLCPDSNHPHMIDLGLPSGTKWSCCNVGADKPESFGGYYAWGETEEKEKYSWETYLYGDGSDYGAYDIGVDIAGTTYDVAYVKQGSNWRMPTLDQMEEITSSCTSEWTTLNDVKGLKITGSNGNSIFLPAAGEKYTYGSTDGLTGDGVKGHYWTSNCQPDFIGNVRLLNFAEDLCGIGSYGRSDGITVRAVASSSSDNEDVIAFADAKVKAICVENWDTNGDGELSYEEAAAVTDLGEVFEGNEEITSFNELKYFTGLTKISEAAFFGDYALKSVELPMGLTSIEHAAFGICSSLTSIFIPKNVTTINGTSFRDCTSLVEITVDGENPVYESPRGCNAIINKNTKTLITGCKVTVVPDGVEIIGPSAFYGQYSIKELVLPASVKQIGSSSYDGCGFETLVIPNTVERIDYAAFWNCHSLATIKLPAKTPALSSKICSNCKKLKEIISLNPNPTAISDDVFIVDFDGTMPNATLYVPVGSKAKYEAADGWKKFKNIVEISDAPITFADAKVKAACVEKWDTNGDGELSYEEAAAVTELEKRAFYENTEITSFDELQFFTGLQSIGQYAFASTSHLTSIIIPQNVTKIAEDAFVNCCDLTSIVVAEGNSVYESPNGCNAVIFKEEKSLVVGCKTTVIPDGVELIDGSAFYGQKDIKSLILPASVKKIGSYSFGACGFETIEIPSTVEGIYSMAFSACKNLTTVILPKTTPLMTSYVFTGCNALQKVISLNENPTQIYDDVFNLSPFDDTMTDATLYVPAGTKEKYEAADGWKKFKNIVETGIIEYKVNDTFTVNGVSYVVNSIEPRNVIVGSGEISDNIDNATPAIDRSTEGTLVIPASVTGKDGNDYTVIGFGYAAFSGCRLTSVTIPETVTTIGEYAFHNSALTSITIPSSVKAIKQRAFQNCSVLKTVNFSEGLESIGWAAFQYCFALESVVLPNGLKTMEGRPFKYSGLTSVSIPGSLERVEQDAFANTKLTSVVIPEGVKFLGASAFSVSSLTSVTIPKSVNEYQGDPFYSANIETVINMNSSPVALDGSIFTNGIANATLYVPAGSKDAYAAADYWKDFKEILEAAVEEEVVYIPNEEEKTVSVETSDKSATEVEIRPEVEIDGEKYEVTSIGEGAFENNENLEKVSIPETIEFIGNNAFAGCTGLKEIRVFAEEPIQLGSASAGTRGDDASSSVFAGVDTETCTLYVPFGSKDKYEQADGWKEFKNIVEMGETAPITIGKSGKASYCGDQSLDFSFSDEVKAYIATGFDKDAEIIWLTRVKDVPAGTPVLIKGEPNKTYDVPVTDSENSYYKNMFKGNTSGDKIQIEETEGNLVNYYLSGDGTFKSVKGYANIGNNKSYLQLPGTFSPAVTGATQTVTVGSAGKASYAAPVDLDFSDVAGLKAFTATGYDKSTKTIWLTRVMKVQKGEGVLLKGDPKEYQIPSVAVQSSYQNMFVGNTSGNKIQVQEKSDDGKWTNYYLKGDGTFVSVNNYVNINNNKCYLALPTEMVSAASTRGEASYLLDEPEVIKMPILFRSLDNDGDGTTAIRETKQSREDGAYYTLQGQRVNNPGKGIYIRNGKKVIVK